ncbi:hypothetical protein DFJ73DRAFT_857950 [Zopfochytrium polystomum]|nr:hypothetical protein DFJ73DRAFT_857950 [Zopfochytrium polystomum]
MPASTDAFTFNWDNFVLGAMVALAIECSVLRLWRLNLLNATLFVASTTPIVSLLLRNGAINAEQNIPVMVVDSLIYICMVGSILLLYLYRLRLFDADPDGVKFRVPADYAIVASQTLFNALDMVLYHLATNKVLPEWVLHDVLPPLYIVEVGHEIAVDVLLLWELHAQVIEYVVDAEGNVKRRFRRRKDIEDPVDRVVFADITHLSFNVILNILMDIGLVIMNYVPSVGSYFFQTKRMVYMVKARLALSLFQGIRSRREFLVMSKRQQEIVGLQQQQMMQSSNGERLPTSPTVSLEK